MPSQMMHTSCTYLLPFIIVIDLGPSHPVISDYPQFIVPHSTVGTYLHTTIGMMNMIGPWLTPFVFPFTPGGNRT
jgi:hypothetical protein